MATGAARRGAGFIALPARPDGELARTPGRPVVRPWPIIGWLPEHASGLDGIERSRRGLERHHPAHQTVTSADQLDTQIHRAAAAIHQERMPITCPKLGMTA